MTKLLKTDWNVTKNDLKWNQLVEKIVPNFRNFLWNI